VPRVHRHLHLYTGSTFITGGDGAGLVVWDARDRRDYIHLKTTDPEVCVRHESQGSPLGLTSKRFQNDRFEAGIVYEDFAIIARPTQLQIYSLRALRCSRSERSSNLLYPIAQYQWPKIDYISMTEQVTWSPHRSTVHAPINILVRFAATSPRGLNHLILHPNEMYSPTDPVDRHNIPYLMPPVPVHYIPAPVRPLTVCPMVMGRYGTALWIDSNTEIRFGKGGVGQRVAGIVLARPAAKAAPLGQSREGYMPLGRAPTVFGYKEDNDWVRLAMDEEEGRIAVASSNGVITLIRYA
jgi:hypothetical protein